MKAIIFSMLIITSNLQAIAQCWQNISAGESHSMGIKQDGTLWGWGWGGKGELGNGANIATNAAIPISIGTHWQSVSTGNEHTIAIKQDGTLWAWGSNEYGQLGDSTLIDKNTPVQVGTAHWLQVCAGYAHNIAIRQDGTLWAWGWNADAQLGDGSLALYKNTPVQISADTNWKNISAGAAFNLAIRQDGTLWVWGRNSEGQLGDGTLIYKNVPVQIGIATDWKIVSAGGGHSTAIRQDGTLWCWGWNDSGQLGDGTFIPKTTPIKIGTDTSWQNISAGGAHSMAIKQDGTLWVWGDNADGQLGDGSPPMPPKYMPVQLGIATDWQSISAGDYYSLALKQNGYLWAWGSNNKGQLGDGTNVTINTATYVPNCWPLEINNISELDEVVSVYPNPAKDKLNINFQQSNITLEFCIYNLFEEIVKKGKYEDGIDISSLQTGLYQIIVKTGQGSIIRKRFLKE